LGSSFASRARPFRDLVAECPVPTTQRTPRARQSIFAVAGCFIYPSPTICEAGYLTAHRSSLIFNSNYRRPATTRPRPGAGEHLELIAQSSVNTVILLSLLLLLPTGLDLAPCQWGRRGGSVGRGSGWWSSRRSVTAPAWEMKGEWSPAHEDGLLIAPQVIHMLCVRKYAWCSPYWPVPAPARPGFHPRRVQETLNHRKMIECNL
jgi:hypothetical protein